MNKVLGIILVVACSLLWSGAAFCSPNIQDGMWEITTMVDTKGMPSGMAMKPMTHTTCLTQKNAVPEQPKKNDCKVSHSFDGNTVMWTMTCPNMTGKGRITYAGATFDGTMESTMTTEKGPMTSIMKMKGKRIGPCKQ